MTKPGERRQREEQPMTADAYHQHMAEPELEKLPRLIEQAASALAKATTAGEVLEAKREAEVAYNAAKLAARLHKIKDAHDVVLAACRRAQADALVIETRAQCRLADEYDAAQQRGELRTKGGDYTSKVPNENLAPTMAEIGLDKKQVHEARQVRDAEKAKPGVVRKTLDEQLKAGQEPTRACVKRAIEGTKNRQSKKHENPSATEPPATAKRGTAAAPEHDASAGCYTSPCAARTRLVLTVRAYHARAELVDALPLHRRERAHGKRNHHVDVHELGVLYLCVDVGIRFIERGRDLAVPLPDHSAHAVEHVPEELRTCLIILRACFMIIRTRLLIYNIYALADRTLSDEPEKPTPGELHRQELMRKYGQAPGTHPWLRHEANGSDA